MTTRSRAIRIHKRVSERWIGEFSDAGGLWRFDPQGDPKRPHALLTSGLHSDAFVNTTFLISRPDLLKKVTGDWRTQLARLADPAGKGPAGAALAPTWIVGSAFGAITLAYEFARQMSCRAGFTEPEGGTLICKRFPIGPDDRVCVVEDVVTTGGTTKQTITACRNAGARVLPWIFVLVDRSDGKAFADVKLPAADGSGDAPPTLVACAKLAEVRTWKPDECPLCAQGSEAVRPKGNWGKLTGKS